MTDFSVFMPALRGKRRQLSTVELNKSRFVTKIRWTVEAVHGIMKQKYRFQDKVIDHKLLKKIGIIYFRIATFLQNQFKKELQSDQKFSDEIVKRMKQQKNVIQSIASNNILYFTEMTDKDLKTCLPVHIYSVKQFLT